AMAVEPAVQCCRIPVEAAVAFAAALRKHVRRRDYFPAARTVGCDRPGRGDLRRLLSHPVGDIPYPDRRTSGLYLHDADRRLHGDRARTSLTNGFPFRFTAQPPLEKGQTMDKLALVAQIQAYTGIGIGLMIG